LVRHASTPSSREAKILIRAAAWALDGHRAGRGLDRRSGREGARRGGPPNRSAVSLFTAYAPSPSVDSHVGPGGLTNVKMIAPNLVDVALSSPSQRGDGVDLGIEACDEEWCRILNARERDLGAGG
jgi:hypothetical protein